ncbi:MAG TPA: hypothetical protein VM571_01720, partial [Noviherbaspirillum sp.]|nr:hypothetical protein [Noviherbaspirillum sp.]
MPGTTDCPPCAGLNVMVGGAMVGCWLGAGICGATAGGGNGVTFGVGCGIGATPGVRAAPAAALD